MRIYDKPLKILKQRGPKKGARHSHDRKSIQPGQKSGLLTFEAACGERRVSTRKSGWTYFITCHCDCGSTVEVDYSNFLNGNARSCGCLKMVSVADAIAALKEYGEHHPGCVAPCSCGFNAALKRVNWRFKGV